MAVIILDGKKQAWGYYTRKNNDVYMIVFNPSMSGHLPVQVSSEQKIVKAILLDGQKETPIYEVARNEYYVDIPSQYYKEPFVIKLTIEDGTGSEDQYMDALI